MLYIILIVGVIGRIGCDQNLSYMINDNISIPYESNIILSSFMSTKANESISGSDVKMVIQFLQDPPQQLINYNIIYFNLQDHKGLKCYQNYFNNTLLPQEMQIIECHNQSINQLSSNTSCYNLTNCQNQSFSFVLQLSADQFIQNVLIIQNTDPQNLNHTQLTLQTSVTMSFQASIAWFYGAIALTCLLLINLVFLTGVTLFWILKYRKTKRIYEQFRLTEMDYETRAIRNTIKQQ